MVHASSWEVIVAMIASVVVAIVGGAVAIVKIRTERSPEIRRAERRTELAKRAPDPERALLLDTLDEVATAKGANPAVQRNILETLQQTANVLDGSAALPTTDANGVAQTDVTDGEGRKVVDGSLASESGDLRISCSFPSRNTESARLTAVGRSATALGRMVSSKALMLHRAYHLPG
jgi:hypothetical protein